MKTSDNITEIAKAMSLLQKQMKPAIKDSLNPHFKSKFCDLESVWGAIRQPLTDNELTLWQDVVSEEKGVSVITRIVHVSGQWVEFGPLTIPLAKFDAQAVGSATSYAKRYSLCAALGVVGSDEDDDGVNAVKRGTVSLSTISEDVYNDFILAQSEVYTEKVLKDYLVLKGKKAKINDPKRVVALLLSDKEMFYKEIDAYVEWLQKQNEKL